MIIGAANAISGFDILPVVKSFIPESFLSAILSQSNGRTQSGVENRTQ